MAKILMVEDERDLAALVSNWLARDHHLVELQGNGADALSQLGTSKYDLIILDLMLPGMNGMEICRAYRRNLGMVPILMLTAKDSVEDKEAGLDAGADDFLTKPFHLKELSARVRALLRRASHNPANVIKIRDITIDLEEFRVTKDGEEIRLLPKEFRLLEFMARHPNRIFSAEDLLESVWESGSGIMVDTVRGHVKRLRQKLDQPGKQSIISTVYSMGYRIESENAS